MSFYRKLRLKDINHENNAKKIVPGSAAWQAAKSDELDVKEATDSDNVVVLEAKTVSSKWTFVGVEDMYGEQHMKSASVILPSNSILCTTVHIGKESVYGVAQSVMEVGKGGDMLVCQGITFLPIGKKWITLALRCNGKSIPLHNAIEDSPEDVTITETEIDVCELICDHLAELRMNDVKENEQLCRQLKLLFEK